MNEKKTRLQEIKRSMGLMGGRPERINTIPTDTPSRKKSSNEQAGSPGRDDQPRH